MNDITKNNLKWQKVDSKLLISTKLISLAIGSLNYVFYIFRMRFFTDYYGFPEYISGSIQTALNIASFGGATFWNNMADWLMIHKILLVLLCLGMGGTFELNLIKQYVGVVYWPYLATAVFGIYGFLLGGILPLGDYHILKLLKFKFDEDESLYGRQALFGMVAYGLVTLGLGTVLDLYGILILFRIVPAVALMAALAIWCFGVSEKLISAKSDTKVITDQKETVNVNLGEKSASFREYIRMLGNRQFLFLIYIILSTGFGRQTLAIFLPHLLAKELKLSNWDISLAYFGSCSFSLLFYFLSSHALRLLGVRNMLLIAQLALITRMTIYSILKPGTSQVVIQLIELMNGFSYSFTHIAGVREAARLAPEGWSAAFQAAYSCAHVQIPAIFMSAIGGIIIHRHGGQALLRGVVVIPALSAIVLAIFLLYEQLGKFLRPRPNRK